MNKKYIIIGLSSLALIGYSLMKYINRDVRKYNHGLTITLSDKNYSSLPSDILDIDEDSLFHQNICSDFNIGWENFDETKNLHKILTFNHYSGKILMYYFKNKNHTILKTTIADKVFFWGIDRTKVENKIIGSIGYTPKDTIMTWVFNDSKKILTDEKGLVYSKRLLNQLK